jgi:antitoxin ParD1/3/4
MEGFIKQKVASGSYGDATEVIRDAIRRMQAEEDRATAWRAAIAIGDAELDRGEGIPYTSDTLNDITRIAIEEMHSGRPIRPFTRSAVIRKSATNGTIYLQPIWLDRELTVATVLAAHRRHYIAHPQKLMA